MPCFGLAKDKSRGNIRHHNVSVKISYGANSVRLLAAIVHKSTLTVDRTKVARSLADELGTPAATSSQFNPEFDGGDVTFFLRVCDARRVTNKTEQTKPVKKEKAVVVPKEKLDNYAPAELLLANKSPSFLADNFRFYQAQVGGTLSYVIDCHGRLDCEPGTAP